jgi:hypothetical protein
MKAILEFNMPEDREDHKYALHGIEYAIILEELDNWLRNMFKYEDKVKIDIEVVRSKIYELLKERNLEI